jgi:hypothetical protein
MPRNSACLLLRVSMAVVLSQPETSWAQALGTDLAIAKSHSGHFTVGMNGVYTIVLSNIGDTAITPGAVHDDLTGLPFEVVSATGTGWNCSFPYPGLVLMECFSHTVIAPGGFSLPITLTVRPTISGTVTNTARAFYSIPPDGTGVAASSDVTIVVAAVPTLPQWAMIALTALVALAGFAALRRRTTYARARI